MHTEKQAYEAAILKMLTARLSRWPQVWRVGWRSDAMIKYPPNTPHCQGGEDYIGLCFRTFQSSFTSEYCAKSEHHGGEYMVATKLIISKLGTREEVGPGFQYPLQRQMQGDFTSFY